MELIQGACMAPKSDSLYIVFGGKRAGYGLGIVIRGEDCNWQSQELAAHIELPLQVNRAEALSFLRTGRLPAVTQQESCRYGLKETGLQTICLHPLNQDEVCHEEQSSFCAERGEA